LRQLLVLIAVIALLWITRYLYRHSSPDLKKIGRYLAVALVAALLLFLLATGRLHWIAAAVAAAIPVLYRLIPLLRYVPLLKNLYKKYQGNKTGGFGTAQAQTSSVNSRFIRMTLNHDSGAVSGEVLQGQFSGKNLQDLSLDQLFQLMEECKSDNESVSLLVAYLDREHPDWRDTAQASGSQQSYNSTPDSGGMTIQEAYEILGLSEGASEADIKAAHRKLISKLHPDHGGSTYLSSKINQAKDTLLKGK